MRFNQGLIPGPIEGFKIVDDAIDPSPFLLIPNASAEAIKKLHEAHINARKAIAEG